MNQKFCMLCEQAVDAESTGLCSKCITMAERISFLIENHKEKARYFLDEKFKQLTDRENIVTDRRKKKYQPPQGPHTPDRRVKARRIWQASDSPKRRKSDLVE
jgi:hypothetical protein